MKDDDVSLFIRDEASRISQIRRDVRITRILSTHHLDIHRIDLEIDNPSCSMERLAVTYVAPVSWRKDHRVLKDEFAPDGAQGIEIPHGGCTRERQRIVAPLRR